MNKYLAFLLTCFLSVICVYQIYVNYNYYTSENIYVVKYEEIYNIDLFDFTSWFRGNTIPVAKNIGLKNYWDYTHKNKQDKYTIYENYIIEGTTDISVIKCIRKVILKHNFMWKIIYTDSCCVGNDSGGCAMVSAFHPRIEEI